MNSLETLRGILGVGSPKVSGTVTRTGSNVTVATNAGVMVVPSQRADLNVGDIVIIESNQITYNLGKESEIKIYDA
ncbi:hypothetical protein NVP1215B_085 [Vibrio phage 1.215.B._10N.222.54.F7]|nr:hypothetical protein NVP1215A_085 [Vibrio phage 1.215.A._10N.222.54.F7]AUR96108.1 hypothetical protein NVP1215B_085 [Vibrio phage 1.215.B._10N.222.54.F7]